MRMVLATAHPAGIREARAAQVVGVTEAETGQGTEAGVAAQRVEPAPWGDHQAGVVEIMAQMLQRQTVVHLETMVLLVGMVQLLLNTLTRISPHRR